MASYVCIIFGKGRGALAVEAFHCDDERSAGSQALTLARANPDAYGYELWDGGRKVANYFAREPLTAVSRPDATGRPEPRG